MKNAIITGANGFVGSALIHELCENGVAVTAVVRNKESNLERIADLEGVHVVYCDMDNISQLPSLVSDKPDVFYHLAWEGSTGNARADYTLQMKNAKRTVDAVNAAVALGCAKFIGAGTLAEFDVNAYVPRDGSTPNAVSCYGIAKIAAHLMSKAECNKQGIKHVWAYLSNTYGIGNYTSNFINFASKLMITGKPADFTSGEQPYDFVYISDTAKGLRCIGEAGKENYAYYIGSTKPARLKQFIITLRDAIDRDIKLNLGAINFNGVQQPADVFDCSKLVEDTGYKPEVTFEDGIKRTVAWLRNAIAEGRL